MSAFRFEGYVIVSAEGMLADAGHVMPDALKFKGDAAFFNAALDRADLIVHGRNSYEDQPNSPRRKRIILTRKISSVAPDPDNAKATLWNPDGASFDAACAATDIATGTIAIIGGPVVFQMFMDRYDTFYLSQARQVHLDGGDGCFPDVPSRTPQQILSSHGLVPGDKQMLDPAHDVTVTPWHRQKS